MDLSFYRLTHNPFPIAPTPEFLVLSPSHQAALQALTDGIERRQGGVAITGEAGLGKTALLHTYLARIDPQDIKTIFLSATRLSLRDLLAMLGQELGLNGATATLAVAADQLRRRLIQESNQGRKVALIIDDAQNIPVQTLCNLRMLSDLMQTSPLEPLLQIVFMGRTEFEHKCNLPELRQLKTRLVICSMLAPLTKKESMAYIHHRLAQVTRQAGPVFTRRALTQIVKHGQGNPRLLNLLCVEVLTAGIASRQKPISARIARQTIARF